MNRDTVGFVVSLALLFFAYFGINSYYTKKHVQESPASSAPTVIATIAAATVAATPLPVVTANATEPVATPAPTPAVIAEASPQELVLDLPLMTANFTQTGGCLGTVKLKQFKEEAQGNEEALLQESYELCKAFGLRIAGSDLRAMTSRVEHPGPQQIRFVQEVNGLEVQKTFDLSAGDYRGSFEIQVRNTTPSAQNTLVGFELGATSEKKSHGFFSTTHEFEDVAYSADDSIKRISLPFKDNPTHENIETVSNISPQWLSSGSIYFLIAALPQFNEPLNLSVESTGFNIAKNRSTAADRTVYDAWVDSALQLAPNSTKSFRYDIYLGPKIRDYLDKFPGKNLHQAIDYGFFKIVAWPIFYVLKWIYAFVGNWGIAIILLTIVLKILFFPLALKAYVASKKMQKLQPELNAVREKYKDDRAKQQQEVMAVMAKSGSNPLSGCLPMLPQIPVFFALFTTLQHTFELRHAPFGLWIHDLSARDPYFLLPILLGISMFIQTHLTPISPSMDPTQQKMMKFLPLVFVLFMFSFPSGLVVYSLTNNIITIIQQQYMMRKYKDV